MSAPLPLSILCAEDPYGGMTKFLHGYMFDMQIFYYILFNVGSCDLLY
jgi:hypothetical protein